MKSQKVSELDLIDPHIEKIIDKDFSGNTPLELMQKYSTRIQKKHKALVLSYYNINPVYD